VQAGERNRGMSIIKSRGTAHSNQVREMILSDAGITVTDALPFLQLEFGNASKNLVGCLQLEGTFKTRVNTRRASFRST
jgi:hypothetical protein